MNHLLSTLALAGVVYAINGSVIDYAPLVNQPCPNVATDPLLRVFTPVNQSLHPLEESYVNTRLTTVIPNEWNNWIGDGSAIGYNLSLFNSSSFPKIGIAISGGGYRAAQYGAGVLDALDARNESAKAAGTGGLLQVTSYLSALSGASQSQCPPPPSFGVKWPTITCAARIHVLLSACGCGRKLSVSIDTLRTPFRWLMAYGLALYERFPEDKRPRAGEW
jgi:lysophospholipase-like protein